MRARNVNRSRLVLDLPQIKPDADGRFDSSQWQHYNRTLQEWARAVTEELEQRTVIDAVETNTPSAVINALGQTTIDLALPGEPVRGGYFYGVHLSSRVETTGANGRFALDAVATGPIPVLGPLADIDTDVNNLGVDGWVLWQQPVDATIDISIVATNVNAVGSITLHADTAVKRSLELVGFGPAPVRV